MNSKYTLIQVLMLVLVIGGAYAIITLIGTFTSNYSMDIPGDDTTQFTVYEEETFDFLHDSFFDGEQYTITQASGYSVVTFEDTDRIAVRITHSESDEDYYLEGLANNTTITINDRAVIGRVTLDPGTYDVTITDIVGFQARIDMFRLAPNGIVIRILLIAFAGIAVLVGTVVFFVYRSRHRLAVEREMEFDGYTYQPQDINELYNVNDAYGDEYHDEEYHDKTTKYYNYEEEED